MIYQYKWSDPSAPTHSYSAGGLISLFDACLVNGYSGRTAAGWTKEYYDAGSNVAVYRAPGGNQCYLRVSDNETYSATVQAYATTTGTLTTDGEEPFSNASYKWWFKGNTTPIPYNWEIYATDKSFYYISGWSGEDYSTRSIQFFGDYVCTNSNFTYNTMMTAGNSSDKTSYNNQYYFQNLGESGKYCWRGWDQVPGYITIQTRSPYSGSWLGNYGLLSYPDRLTGAFYMDRVQLLQNGTLMGFMPGLYDCPYARPYSVPFEFEGTDSLLGKRFSVVPLYNAMAIIQITGDWYA